MKFSFAPEIKCCKNVIIKDSKIHGKGLFATQKIREGTVVAFYDGIYVDFEDDCDFEDRVMVSVCSGSCDYVQNLCDSERICVLAGFPNPSRNRFGIATYANTGFVNTKPDIEEAADIIRCNNLDHGSYLIDNKVGIQYIACRNIKAGEELCINYGYGYWKDKHKQVKVEGLKVLQERFGMNDDMQLNFNKWQREFTTMKNEIATINSMYSTVARQDQSL